jgi:hypothetical protein
MGDLSYHLLSFHLSHSTLRYRFHSSPLPLSLPQVRTPLNTAAVGLMLLEEEIAALNTQGVEIPARLLEVVSAIRDACGNALEVRNISP